MLADFSATCITEPSEGPQFFLRRTRGTAAFAPTDIAGLKLWLKADAGLFQDAAGTTPATANNDPVGLWTDQSGNGLSPSQSTDANRPLLKTSVQNSLPGLLFDGVNDLLSKDAATGMGGTAWSIFAAVKKPNTNTGVALCFGKDPATSSGYSYPGTHTGQIALLKNGVAWTDSGTTFPTPGAILLGGIFGSGTFTFYQNGSSLGTASPTFTTPGSFMSVGDDRGGDLWNGHCFELLAYDSALDDTNRGLVETYLNGRWAIY